MDMEPWDPLDHPARIEVRRQESDDSDAEGGLGNVTRVVLRPPGHSGKAKRGHLCFDASYEGGNLGRVDFISEYEYDLFIRPDTCNPRYRMWFNFVVDNVRADQRVIFNLVNLCKIKTLYRDGMTPLVKTTSRPKWQRLPGKYVYYHKSPEHRNHYILSFAFAFDREEDVYQFAFSFPYSYSRCQAHLDLLEGRKFAHFKRETIGTSLQGRKLEVVTISNIHITPGSRPVLVSGKRPKIVLILARINPGETPTSYIAQGLMDFMISTHPLATALRDYVIIKIVPMINPDGAYLGNYRTSLMGYDLNRHWNQVSPWSHPTLQALKSYIIDLDASKMQDLDMIIDLHTHASLMGAFIYGNAYDDVYRFERHILFPKLLAHNAEDYNGSHTMYNRDPNKAGSARRHLCEILRAAVNIYTLEVSYFGYNQPLSNSIIAYNEEGYLRLGRNLARTFFEYYKATGIIPASVLPPVPGGPGGGEDGGEKEGGSKLFNRGSNKGSRKRIKCKARIRSKSRDKSHTRSPSASRANPTSPFDDQGAGGMSENELLEPRSSLHPNHEIIMATDNDEQVGVSGTKTAVVKLSQLTKESKPITSSSSSTSSEDEEGDSSGSGGDNRHRVKRKGNNVRIADSSDEDQVNVRATRNGKILHQQHFFKSRKDAKSKSVRMGNTNTPVIKGDSVIGKTGLGGKTIGDLSLGPVNSYHTIGINGNPQGIKKTAYHTFDFSVLKEISSGQDLSATPPPIYQSRRGKFFPHKHHHHHRRKDGESEGDFGGARREDTNKERKTNGIVGSRKGTKNRVWSTEERTTKVGSETETESPCLTIIDFNMLIRKALEGKGYAYLERRGWRGGGWTSTSPQFRSGDINSNSMLTKMMIIGNKGREGGGRKGKSIDDATYPSINGPDNNTCSGNLTDGDVVALDVNSLSPLPQKDKNERRKGGGLKNRVRRRRAIMLKVRGALTDYSSWVEDDDDDDESSGSDDAPLFHPLRPRQANSSSRRRKERSREIGEHNDGGKKEGSNKGKRRQSLSPSPVFLPQI